MCNAIYKSMFIGPQGQVYPCCWGREPIFNIENMSIIEAFESEEFNKFRAGLSDKSPCTMCKKITKDNNKNSFSNTFQSMCSTGTNVELEYLHITLHNICDLSCMTCCNDYSINYKFSKFNSDKKISINFIGRLYLEIFEALKKYDIKKICIQGGEIYKTKGMLIDILNAIKDSGKKIVVEIISNGNTMISNDIIEIYESMNEVCFSFIFSVDGPKRINEVIRIGVKSDTIYENIRRIANSKINIKTISTHTTVSTLNVIHLHEYFSELKAVNLYDKIDSFNLFVLEDPTKFSLYSLEENASNIYIDKIKEIIETNNFNKIELDFFYKILDMISSRKNNLK